MQMNTLKIIRIAAVVMTFAWGTGRARADWSFVIMGDTRGHHDTTTGVSTVLHTIATKIAEKNPDLVVCCGDQVNGNATNGLAPLTYAQQFDNWKTAMNPVYALNIPIYTVRGNHENHADEEAPLLDLKQAYYDALGVHMPTNGPNNGPTDDQRGYTYSFTHSNATFMVVDQYFYPATPTGGYHSIDQAWLGQQLQQSNTPYKIVMAHEPVYLDHFYGTSSTGMAHRAEFWDSLGTNGARLYICGHTHNLSVSLAPDAAGNNIYQLLSGNGGAELDAIPPVPEAGLDILYSNTTHYGFAYATVSAEKMTIEYYLLKPSDETWSKASYTTQILPNTMAPARPAQVFFQEPKGWVASWLLATNGTFQSARLLGSAGAWQLMTAGDVDGDGVSDLLFQTPAGDTAGWLLNPAGSVRSVINWGNVGAWKVRACADYLGAGHAQIFFQHPKGITVLWHISTNGVFQSAEVILTNASPWQLCAAIPHTAGGLADLYWQTAAGLVAVWQQQPGGGCLAQVVQNAESWRLCGATDIDHDGVGDLLWQTAGGNTAGWFMSSNNTMRSNISWWNTGDWKLKAGGR